MVHQPVTENDVKEHSKMSKDDRKQTDMTSQGF